MGAGGVPLMRVYRATENTTEGDTINTYYQS